MAFSQEVKNLATQIAATAEQRKKELDDLRAHSLQSMMEYKKVISELGSARKERTKEQQRELLQNEKERKEQMLKSIQQVQEFIKDITASRKENTKLQNDRLSQGRIELSKERGVLSKEREEFSKEVTQMRKELCDERLTNAKALHQELSDSVLEDKKEVRKLREEAQALCKELEKSRVVFRNELKQAKAAWDQVLKGEIPATSEKKIEGYLEKKETEKEQKAVEEPSIPVERAVESKIEEAIIEKLVNEIAKHPDGILLTDLAAIIDVAPIVLGRPIYQLIKAAKISKRDKLYYPI